MKSTNIETKSLQVAKILLENGAVLIKVKTPFKFDSGILSPIYVDNRRLISLPKERNIIIGFFVQKIREIGLPDVVAGTATAGIPHAAWIAHNLNIPMVYVRPKPKDHGLGNQVEGTLKRGQKIIVIEDMVSTAGSSVEVIKALRAQGAKVIGEVAIYSHNMKTAEENFKKIKVKFWSLTNLSQVLKVAQKKGYLRPDDQIEKILEWAKDPKNWGKKMGFE